MCQQQYDLNGFSREGNSQLSSLLRTELENAKNEIKELKTTNEKLRGTIDEKQKEYETLKTEKKNIDDQYKKLQSELEERLEAMKPLRVLVQEAENLCEKYSTLKDNAITEKQQIMNQLAPFFHLVHYAEDSKDLFEYAGHRKRLGTDPLEIDRIETYPALLITKSKKCISKGKYVMITDEQ